MIKLNQVLLALALLGCLSAICLAGKIKKSVGEENKEPLGIAADVVTKSGSRLIFPFFSNELQTIHPKLKEYLAEDTRATNDFLYETVSKQLSKKGSPGVVKLTQAGKALLNMATEQNKRRNALQADVATRGAFNAYMSKVFDKLMEDSSKLTKLYKDLDHEALDKDLRVFFDDLSDVVEASPVAMYVRFDEAKWNDSTFIEVASHLIARLKTHGFGTVIKFVGWMLALIRRFGPSA